MDSQHSPQSSPAQPKQRKGKRTGYVFSIFFSLLFLYIANNLLDWGVQFVTREWSDVLTVINISGIVNVVGYAAFLCYDKRMFYFFGRTILDGIALIVTVRLYTVFPFEFSKLWGMDWMNEVFPWLLLLGIVGIIIGIIVRSVRLVTNKNIHY